MIQPGCMPGEQRNQRARIVTPGTQLARGVARRARCDEGCSGTYGTGPQVDPVLLLAVLEPTAALFLPDGGLVELVEVLVDLVEGLLRDGDRSDVVVLDLLHHLDRVLDGRLDRGQECARAPRSTRSLILVRNFSNSC